MEISRLPCSRAVVLCVEGSMVPCGVSQMQHPHSPVWLMWSYSGSSAQSQLTQAELER